MAYTPTEWETGDVITAEKLNNMEQGIEDTSLFCDKKTFYYVLSASQTQQGAFTLTLAQGSAEPDNDDFDHPEKCQVNLDTTILGGGLLHVANAILPYSGVMGLQVDQPAYTYSAVVSFSTMAAHITVTFTKQAESTPVARCTVLALEVQS